jgi:SWI/SNF-related matrix-associated actin-dependent regulator 1 of chromatin subfamily A
MSGRREIPQAHIMSAPEAAGDAASSPRQCHPTLQETLLPFQREGVAKGLQFGGRLLLGDEMGLGKTLQAIALALRYRDEWPLLITCPTSLCLPWCEELERWVPDLLPGDIDVVRSIHNSRLGRAPVTILTYGLATNGKERKQICENVAAARFRVAIADEAHYLKSKDAQRSKLLLPVLQAASRCILLTGTPALSRPVELFTLVSTVRPRAPPWASCTQPADRTRDLCAACRASPILR